MIKLIYLLMTCALLTSCSNKISQSEYDNLKNDLAQTKSRLEQSMSEHERVKNELDNLTTSHAIVKNEKEKLEAELEYYVYKSGTPTTEGHDNSTNTELIAAMEDELINTNCIIEGTVIEPTCYFDEETDELSSISYYITTEKGGKYEAFNIYDENGLMTCCIYINSEFCYTWYRDSMAFMPEPKTWRLDGLSDFYN